MQKDSEYVTYFVPLSSISDKSEASYQKFGTDRSFAIFGMLKEEVGTEMVYYVGICSILLAVYGKSGNE